MLAVNPGDILSAASHGGQHDNAGHAGNRQCGGSRVLLLFVHCKSSACGMVAPRTWVGHVGPVWSTIVNSRLRLMHLSTCEECALNREPSYLPFSKETDANDEHSQVSLFAS